MSTLVEIESAIEQLPATDKQKLLMFLAQSLRSDEKVLPEPRRFSSEEVSAWISEDERDLSDSAGRP